MGKIFLVGYYGYNNFGDELLLNSMLKILNDVKFQGEVIIPSDNLLRIETPISYKVTDIKKFDLYNIVLSIKSSDLVIFGGGNLFQTETSLKSFLYYYYIAKKAIKYKKPLFLISQGFGPIKNKFANKLLKSLLKTENAQIYGFYRDEASFRYARRYCKSSFNIVDIAPYAISDIGLRAQTTDITSICIKKDYDDFMPLYEFLEIDNRSINTLAINSNQDSEISFKFVDYLRSVSDWSVPFPTGDNKKIQSTLINSKLVISDRLHSAVVPMYFGVPVLVSASAKNRRVVKNICPEYDYFYKKLSDIPGAYAYMKARNYDPQKTAAVYREKLSEAVQTIEQNLRTFL